MATFPGGSGVVIFIKTLSYTSWFLLFRDEVVDSRVRTRQSRFFSPTSSEKRQKKASWVSRLCLRYRLVCFPSLRCNTSWQKPGTRSCSTRVRWRTRRTCGGGWRVWRNPWSSTSTWRDRSSTAAGRHRVVFSEALLNTLRKCTNYIGSFFFFFLPMQISCHVSQFWGAL